MRSAQVAATLSPEAIDSIVAGQNGDPFAVLGPHKVAVDGQPATAVRVFLPWAQAIQVVTHDGGSQDTLKLRPEGFFEAILPRDDNFGYRLHVTDPAGNMVEMGDPYSFGPLLSDYDLYLFGEGTHYRPYEKLGAHIREVGGFSGVHFAVWAPNARVVSVVGNFNHWDSRVHPMRKHPSQGIWEIFIPGLVEGEAYKYEVKSPFNDYVAEKADPMGFYAELRPRTASLVADIEHYTWNDQEWLQNRAQHNSLRAPISIYEVHLGSWKKVPEDGNRPLTYRELAHDLVDYVKYMGFTHIELLPISEHPLDASWGYQTVGYYAVTSRYGTPKDFMYFVDLCHQNGIGVFLDWVPAHFPKDIQGLNYFDGTHLYEHADPRLGEHPDWGTLVFNFGRTEVRTCLLSSALFWLDQYHIDGLRVDAVASMLYLDFSRPEGAWIPNKYGGRENLEAIDFLKRFNELVHMEHPDILTMAEDSTAWPMVTRPTFLGGLGFDLKWNMGWMHDMLDYLDYDPIYRRYHHNLITFSLMYAFSENFLLPLSHDEVVHLKQSLLNKMPGDGWQQFANLRTLFGYMWSHPGKKLLFMGSEFGQRNEWSEERSLDWHETASESHHKMQNYMHDLLHLYQAQPALWQVDDSWTGFEWLSANDSENSVIAFARRAQDPEDLIVVVCNFTPVPRTQYYIPAPRPGYYREILNSDSEAYWGTNRGNLGGVEAVAQDWAPSGYALSLTLPPLSTIMLKFDPQPLPVTAPAEEAGAPADDAAQTGGSAPLDQQLPNPSTGSPVGRGDVRA
jgi:1,4-alpha-glucan branching enzyme